MRRWRAHEDKANDQANKDGAMTILCGPRDKATNLGTATSVSVVDEGELLIAFGRSADAEPYSISISTAKAWSAAITRFPSGKKSPSGKKRDDHHALAIILVAGPRSFVTIPGGLPIIVHGHCIGATGASGTARHDVDSAQAGIEALERS